MKRLARLLPFRQFGRFRPLRALRDCNAAGAIALSGTSARAQSSASLWPDLLPDPCIDLPQTSRPAFARVALRAPQQKPAAAPRQLPAASAGPAIWQEQRDANVAATDPVRVYRGPSRVTLVGHIDAVCRMLDRCIAEENAGLTGGLFEQPV
jgi:hypothetical protein